MNEGPRYYGVYRGKVRNNVDPKGLGRLMVDVASVPGASPDAWANPCVAFAGSSLGVFALPPRDANVWVQFEEGNPEDPIWIGGFWDDLSRPPAMPPLEMTKVLKTSGVTLTITDVPGAARVELTTDTGAKIAIGPEGIEITNGLASIKLTGPQVSLNGDALEVL